jgi:Zn-dependent protease with chaperone function
MGDVSDLVSRRLRDLSPKAYEHPADRAATAALQSIPGLDTVIRKLIELRYERALRQSLLASAVRVGPDQLPTMYTAWQEAEETLDLPRSYDLYVAQFPIPNAAALGATKPIVVVNSAAISLFDEAELKTVLAHEAGHILSDHVLYRTALLILLQLAPLGRVPTLAGLPTAAIRTALLEWSRAAELSADRAATLVNRDPLVTSRTLLVLASGLPSNKLNVDAFLRQAQDYHQWDSTWDRISRTVSELNLTHSHPVRRVAELMAWVRSGEYDRIIGGSYRHRGEKADPSAEAEDALRHYRSRFQKLFEDTSESLTRVPEAMADWLTQIRR